MATVSGIDSLHFTDLSSAHKDITRLFTDAGIATASLDARLLICGSCDIRYETLVARPEQEVPLTVQELLKQYVVRRLQGEPVSRIFGQREFWSHSFALNEDTLDPRPDTETLVDFALELIAKKYAGKNGLRILDLGTGTGCILLSLLSELKTATGVGVDVSPNALQAARRNADTIGVTDRVHFIQSSWMDDVSDSFDIVVSNPPYIPSGDISGLMPEVRDFDPARALDGGDDGLHAYRVIIKQTAEKLSNALVVFEIGKGQEKDVKNLLMSYKTGRTFSNISYKYDLTGIIRCIAAEIKK